MQKAKIKPGRFYAYTNGTKMYGHRSRIKVIATDHPFERTYRRGYGASAEVVTKTEPGILATEVAEDNDEPKVTKYRSQEEPVVAKPFEITETRKVIQTWDDELAERRRRNDQAADDQAAREASEARNEQLRADLLSFLGQHGGEEAQKIKEAPILGLFGQPRATYLALGEVTPQRLLRLLNAAYQAGRAAGASDIDTDAAIAQGEDEG